MFNSIELPTVANTVNDNNEPLHFPQLSVA